MTNFFPGVFRIIAGLNGSSGELLSDIVCVVAVSGFVKYWMDQLCRANAVAESQAGQGIAFGQGAQQQDIVAFDRQMHRVVFPGRVNEIHVGFIDQQ